jgi:processive 1,2-diacylglycerol beta-glucosyltransferase
MKKVLILYAKYGGGHQSAAHSLEDYIKNNYSDVTVETLDCVEYVTPFFSKITTDAYKFMARKANGLWRNIYYNSPKGFWFKLSDLSKKYLAHGLLKKFNEFSPDIIISVHPFGSQVTAYLKEKCKINCKLATVFTDFTTHFQWLIGKEFNDYFFVSNENMKKELLDLNIPEEKINITGIPISSKFTQNMDSEAIYEELHLDNKLKTILFFGGGEFGLGQTITFKVFEELLNYINDYQIVAISGRNKKMYNKFLEYEKDYNNIHILEYSNKVPELMNISNLVVTKPGGLTSSESLASNLPLLIINPIPGQEEENANYFVKSGAAIWLKENDNLSETLKNILSTENTLNTMSENCAKIAHKYATADICKKLL